MQDESSAQASEPRAHHKLDLGYFTEPDRCPLCELIASHGETKVRRAMEQIASTPSRSLKRRLAYVVAIVSDET